MKSMTGLWIDHRKALIVSITDETEKKITIESNVEKHAGRIDGVRSVTPYESQLVPADDSRENEFTEHLARYYDQVIASVHDADAIFIFGPGEAKGELKHRLEKKGLGEKIKHTESADRMTDRQIAAKVRKYFSES